MILTASAISGSHKIETMALTFTVTVDSHCRYGNSVTAGLVQDMQTTIFEQNESDVQILTSWPDNASTKYGNQDGATLCGARNLVLVSEPQSWLKIDSTSLKIMLQSSSATDEGTYTITVKQCLKSWGYCSEEVSFTVIVKSDKLQTKSKNYRSLATDCVVNSTTVNGSLSNQQWFVYQMGTVDVTMPTYTQEPACGYTQEVTILQSNGSAIPSSWLSILSQPTNTTAGVYRAQSTNFSDIGTYELVLKLSFSDQPAGQTPYTDTSVTWNVTISNGCTNTTFADFGFSSGFPTINITVLQSSGATIQNFSEPRDEYSTNYDANEGQSTWVYWDSSSGYSTAAPGAYICGPRAYTVSSNCSSFLSVNNSTAHKPYFEALSSSTNDGLDQTHACSITAYLQNFPQITQTITQNVYIGRCVITSFTQNEFLNSTQIYEYIMMGNSLKVPFPTFTQTPACNYTVVYACNHYLDITWPNMYPDGTVTSSPRSQSPTNAQNISTCDSTLNEYRVDLKEKNVVTNLTPYQFQGDYAVKIVATTSGALTNYTVDNYSFILSVKNPCNYESSSQLNFLTAPAIDTINATVLEILNQTIQPFIDQASMNYTTVDNYTLCGIRTYTITPTSYTAFVSISGDSIGDNQLVINATDQSLVNYVGNPGTYGSGQTCYTLTLSAQLANYPTVSSAQKTFNLCIEECKPTAFYPSNATLNQQYTIYTTTPLQFSQSLYVQEPQCNYSVTYTATLQKTTAYLFNSDPVFAAIPLDQISCSYINYYNTSSSLQFSAQSQILNDCGIYKIVITAELQEFKWNQTLNSNNEGKIILTMADPCSSTTFTQQTQPSFQSIVLRNMTTSVKGTADIQTFGLFIDEESKKTMTSNTDTANLKCGGRFYTFGGQYSSSTTWLQFDNSTGTLTASTNYDSDVNYVGGGYQVTIKACLDNYPETCSSEYSFYVKVTECVITEWKISTIQGDITGLTFTSDQNYPVTEFEQTPACGWPQTVTAKVNGTTMPYWLTIAQLTSTQIANWMIQAWNKKDEGLSNVVSTVFLNYTIDGVPNFMTISQTFTITLTNPCKTTKLIQQNGLNQTFDVTNLNWNNPSMYFSILQGTDLYPAAPVKPTSKIFDNHQDEFSKTLMLGQSYACGPRNYTFQILQCENCANPSYIGNFTTLIQGDTQSTIKLSSSNDIDIGYWLIQITVQLGDYIGIVPSITEYLWVQIDSCIVNQILQVNGQAPMPLARYSKPATPFTYNIYYNSPTYMFTNEYVLQPRCNYTLNYTLKLPDQANKTATYDNIGILNENALSTQLSFQSQNSSLDNCTYGDPELNQNATTCYQINPYRLQFVAYLLPGRFNSKSQVSENSTQFLYVWPKNPCRLATLLPDLLSTKNIINYFLDDETLYQNVESTLDNVSLSNDYGKPIKQGNERCGARNYKVVIEDRSTDSALAVVVQTQDPPVIMIRSSAAALVGRNQLYLMSWLADYDFIQNYTSVTVMVYQLMFTRIVTNKVYQVGSIKQQYQIPTFYIDPSTDEYQLEYSVDVYNRNGNLIAFPAWLTFKISTLVMTVQTKSIQNIGIYTITIRGKVLDNSQTKPIYLNIQIKNSFTLTIQKDPPPIQITAPPVFLKQLEDQTFLYGQPMTYQLPETFDENSYLITLTITSTRLIWLAFETNTNTFSVKRGDTKVSDSAAYLVKIQLSTQFAKQTYSFNINVLEKEVKTQDFQILEQKQKQAPIPHISFITNKGYMQIKWDKTMKIPRNLTLVRISNITLFNQTTGDQIQYPVLKIVIVPGSQSNIWDLDFDWQYVKWTEKAIEIQLQFKTPLKVSHYDSPDIVKVIFYGTSFFADKRTGAQVQGGSDPIKGSVPEQKLPPQLPWITAASKSKSKDKQDSALEDVGQVILNLMLSYFLNNLWSMIQTQQIIVLIPLFDVQLPDNAGQFFHFLMKVASFDIIPTDEIYKWVFQCEAPDPLNENFDIVGFGTTYFIFNLGSLTFAILAFPIQVVLGWLLKHCYGFSSAIRRGLQIEKNIYWTQTIMILQGSYTILIVCACIQGTALEWESGYAGIVNSAVSLIFYVVCIVYPFFQFAFCWINFPRIPEKSFKKRFGSFWEGQNTENRGFIFYNAWFILRRLLLGFLVVYLRNNIFYQISGLVFQTILAIIIAGNTNSFDSNRANNMEFFNETCILLVMYNILCFTDFQPVLEIRNQQGYIVCFCVMFHIGVNLILIATDMCHEWHIKWKKYRLLRKYAKTRGEQHLKIQKKKRHERWLKKTGQILQRNGKPLEPGQEVQEESELKYPMQHNDKNSFGLSDSAQDNSDQSLNHGDPVQLTNNLFARKPVDSPDIIQKKIQQFEDNTNKVDSQTNQKLGRQQPVEFKNNFETDVHKQLAKAIPLDPLFDDPQAIRDMDEPEEWRAETQDEKIKRRAPVDQGMSLEKTNSLLILHNRLTRMAEQDVKFTKSRVKPVEKKSRGQRVMADVKKLHERLFVQFDAGDGQKQSSKQKMDRLAQPFRKPIVSGGNQIKNPKTRDIPIPQVRDMNESESQVKLKIVNLIQFEEASVKDEELNQRKSRQLSVGQFDFSHDFGEDIDTNNLVKK